MSWPPRASNYRRQETFKEYELRSVFVSQVRGREGKTGEKLTFLVSWSLEQLCTVSPVLTSQIINIEFRTLPAGTVSIDFDLRD
jgi:hypothetical protein